MTRLLCLIGLASLLPAPLRAQDLTVLTAEFAGGPPKQMLSRYLKAQAFAALERRRLAFEALKTPEDMAQYTERLRKSFIDSLGGFPERTPLNAKVIGTLNGDRYRLEKIMFESQPHHHVPAVLFLPVNTEPPYPVVLMPCGHSKNGKVENQIAGAFLAQNGFACFCYDPIGQGERYQLLDGQGKTRFGPTTEHTLLGAGSIPLGRNTATYRIWDGMRSIDYLTSRKDIDAKKIGVSGCSGGGTLTSYLMALDERVACAAPSCYVTSFRRLLETLGPQDAEQNIHGQIAYGMDHVDYLLMRAPRPTLILAGTQDFFDITGTWDSFRQAQRFYTKLGFGERVAIVETDTKHGFAKQQREAMVRWMRHWMIGKNEPVTQGDIKARQVDDFQCTPRGQVMLMEGERSVVDLNVELNASLALGRAKLWESKNRQAALAKVRKIAGIRPLNDLPKNRGVRVEYLQQNGFAIDKFILDPEPGIRLPVLLYFPAKMNGRRCLYLHGAGMKTDAGPGGPIAKLVEDGTVVLAVDVRGIGELAGNDSVDFFTAFLLGKSLVGMRAEDILQAGRILAEWANEAGKLTPIDMVAIGVTGPPALHAAALEPQLFGKVKLVRSLASWSDLVGNPSVAGHLVSTVHGALRVYDLPDLQRSLPAERLVVEEPVDLKSMMKR